METISKLKDKHNGEDIYVVCSGASMDYLPPEFFDGKITVGVNHVWMKYKTTYLLVHHLNYVRPAMENAKGSLVISPLYDCADVDSEFCRDQKGHYVYTHKAWRYGDQERSFDLNLGSIGKDLDLMSYYSVIFPAMHFAAFLGAKRVFLCGNDGGFLNGKSHFKGYRLPTDQYNTVEDYYEYLNDWFEKFQEKLVIFRDKLKEVYECEIVSVSPFLNFGLEKNMYTKRRIKEVQDA